jgi:3'(2'), 5'-bisphosphate nucleotidase
MSEPYTDPTLLQDVIAIARAAGAATLPYYRREKRLAQQHKPDKTLLTQADLVADEIVRENLFGLDYSVPTLTEETASHFSWQERQLWSAYWLVDPLDGTRGFVEGDACYTVNIALIIDHRPVLGVIYAPVSDRLFYAASGQGAVAILVGRTAEKLRTTSLDWQHLRLVTGHFHSSEPHLLALADKQSIDITRMNSSYKFCEIAAGKQDVYPKYTDTSEWDTAAGQIILEEAGGVLVNTSGQPLTYNTKESLINPSFLALGDAAQQDDMLKLIF